MLTLCASDLCALQDEHSNPVGLRQDVFDMMCGPVQLPEGEEGAAGSDVEAAAAGEVRNASRQKWTHQSVTSSQRISTDGGGVQADMAELIDAEIEGVIANILGALKLPKTHELEFNDLVQHYVGGFVSVT